MANETNLNDDELRVMGGMVDALSPLDANARARVVAYLAERYLACDEIGRVLERRQETDRGVPSATPRRY